MMAILLTNESFIAKRAIYRFLILYVNIVRQTVDLYTRKSFTNLQFFKNN